MRRLALLSPVVLLLILPATAPLAAAQKLPAGGGEPGKDYLACLAALDGKDRSAMVERCFAPGDLWIASVNLDYFDTSEALAVHLHQHTRALRLAEVQISGGRIEGDEAVLELTGKVVIWRQESWGEILEVERNPVQGTITLTRTAAGWRATGDELADVYD